MRTVELVGKKVMATDAGRHLGQVEDLLLDDSGRRIVGMLITDGVLSKQQVIPIADLQTAGADAVLVRTGEHLTDAKEWRNRGLGTTRTRTLIGKQVVAADGERLGTVSGIVADDAGGEVRSLEVQAAGRGSRTPLVVEVDPTVALDRDVIVARGAVVRDDETHAPADEV